MDVRHLLIAVSSLAISAYYAAIWYVWQNAGSTIDLTYPSGFITLIGGTLATHFGAVFGMNRANERQGNPKIVLGTLESIAAWSYLLSLTIAVVLWGFNKFDGKYVEAIRNLALTFPGVIAGVLAVAVNVNTDAPPKQQVTPDPNKPAGG